MSLRWLKPGDVVAGVGGALLLFSLFRPWYSVALSGAATFRRDLTGWEAFAVIDVLLALAAVVGIALPVMTATRRTPAIPVALGVIGSAVAPIALLLVLVRILDQPGPNEFLDVQDGAWLALTGAALLVGGAWRSLADERNRGVAPTPVELRPAP